MIRIKYKNFQKYVSNIAIVLMLCFLMMLTFQGGVVGAFSDANKKIAVYNGNSENNVISIMINVYMGNEYVEQILDILEKNDVCATFFVGGIWVHKNETCFLKIANSKNEIGSHGYWHKSHSKLTDEQQTAEIKMNHEQIFNLTGKNMNLFAPPSGDYNSKTVEICESLGYKTIMWSKDTIDWRDQDENIIYKRATSNVEAGDLILMHPTKATANVLEKIIVHYKNLGFVVSTVSENIK